MASLIDEMTPHEAREFFSKGWITHDAMWYYHAIQECGVSVANRLNMAAVKTMSMIEIQRIRKRLGAGGGPVRDFEEFKRVFSQSFDLIKPDFMHCHYSFPAENILRAGFKECFAYEGVKKAGLVEHYQCGVIERIKGWLEAMGIAYEINPQFSGCLMHQTGSCSIDFLLRFT
ncbi:MAG TPA: hypothetical protein PKM65_18495 [Spirochaetota bacterium]|nr:hypothetical protein [Spirochaetota bacterium]HNT13056.1 hypothetical protein [Spirochaetota bacterium]HNV48544.1 hypothetical protein [Spirochaetota bacterium]HOS39459.1 hypothetical protein [Spirochaetota bacterium]HPU89164.1 hypothetical protein [Spirochaetota bacterium]